MLAQSHGTLHDEGHAGTGRAVQTYLGQLEKARIDAEFARMAQDRPYQALALEVSGEFEQTDREALEIGEGER
jgi:hypothetical protein